MIYLGSDHAGLALKQELAAHLSAAGQVVQDLGTHNAESCDYPEVAIAVSRAVADRAGSHGILICGYGTGMAITANKINGIRAAMCANELQARLARAHNNANILCLGARLQGAELALAVADAFMSTSFEGGRHARRVALIAGAEQESRS